MPQRVWTRKDGSDTWTSPGHPPFRPVPQPPASFIAEAFDNNRIRLRWTLPDDPTITRVRRYNKGVSAGYMDAESLVWESPALGNGTYTYTLTTVNAAGAESEPIPAPTVTLPQTVVVDPPPVTSTPKATRDALLSKTHYTGAPVGMYVPDNVFTPGSVGVYDSTLTGYTVNTGSATPLGGRKLTLSTPNLKFTKTVFECAIEVTAGAVNSFGFGPQFDDCWTAGPNPDQIVYEYTNFPQRDANGTSQWTPAACITNFTNGKVVLNDCTVSNAYYHERGRASRVSTMVTAGLRGANFKGYRLNVYGVTDPWNHNGVSGVTDPRSEFELCRFGPAFYANRLTATPYQGVQSGNDTHSDGAQSNIGRFGTMRRCYIGGPHLPVATGNAVDFGPTGGMAPDAYYSALQLQQENGVKVDDIDIQDCWLAGGVVTVNFTYNTAKTPLNAFPAATNKVTNNRFMAINATWQGVQNKTGAYIYASTSITADFSGNVTWDPNGSPAGTGTPVTVTRKADINN